MMGRRACTSTLTRLTKVRVIHSVVKCYWADLSVAADPSEASSSVKAIPVKRPAAAPVESGAKKVKVTPARVHSQKGQTRVYV